MAKSSPFYLPFERIVWFAAILLSTFAVVLSIVTRNATLPALMVAIAFFILVFLEISWLTRIVVIMSTILILALGLILVLDGWLDLSFWDFERAKPSPHYLGLPKIP